MAIINICKLLYFLDTNITLVRGKLSAGTQLAKPFPINV